MDMTTLPMCRCGSGPVAVKTSRTENNPGHKFLCCPNKKKVVTNLLYVYFLFNYCVNY